MVDFKLSFTYENEKEEALKNVEGKVEKGKCIVLCGGSGCGKTTLIRCFNHLIPEFFEGELKGYVSIKGENIEDYSVGKVGRAVASVFQDPRSHFFTINSSTEVAFAMENFGVNEEEMKKRVNDAFSLFGLQYLQNRNVYELSSGEKQLISILSAWACNTDILILDEPTANLDYMAIKELSKLLVLLKKQGKTLILSEHRLHYLTDIADEYWIVKNGEIDKKLSKEEMLLLNEEELSKLSLRTTDLRTVTVEERESVTTSKINNTLKVNNLSFSYKRKRKATKATTDGVLSNLSFSAKTGEVVGLIGSNGCGKTTFGKIVSGLIKSKSGTISINDKILSSKELAKKTLFIMQETEFQFFTNTVMNELSYGHVNVKKEELDKKIEVLLKKCDMWNLRNRHPFSLSGGQMQRLALMIASLSDKPLVILDEPTAGLDKKSLEGCVELIKEMSKTKIVLIITHDLELIAKACTRCECIKDGSFEKSFNLENKESIQEVLSYMDNSFTNKEKNEVKVSPLKKGKLDPRTKLFITIITFIIMTSTNINLVLSVQALVFILGLVEGFYLSSLIGGLSLIILWIGSYIFPGSMFGFFANFIPRMIMPFLTLQTIICKEEGTRTLAAFRKLHISERLIMIFSVIFRFFPVLSNDLKLMNQSIKTRGIFQKFSEKIKAFPSYLEVMIVPLALRVIKIAESLSASAETRGIALNGKRTSYVSIKFTYKDIIFFILTVIAIGIGIII